MLLMSVNNLSRAFDRGVLFDDITFDVFHGDRIGLVGPNGTGKTTMMRILAGQDTPDSGEVKLHADAEAVILDQVADFGPGQTLFAEAEKAFEHLLHAQDELVRVAEAMSVVTDPFEQKALNAKFERLNEHLQHNDAYALDHKVEQVLGGLGFKSADYKREVRSFSGGQQRRLLLAKLLLSSPDVMLLDEPSNHLDIDTTRWLEGYLARQPQGMIVVSHDRYFLDKVANKIFELHARKITSYPGNFRQYVRLRDERYERMMKEWEAQREMIEKQEEYIRRAHYGQMAKQAQSRVKMLDKLERVDRPTKVSGPRIQFNDVTRAGDVVFHVEDLAMAFGDKPLFSGLGFDVKRGQRFGIMGPNGTGKTTLLKILLGELEPTAGKVQRGHLVFPGYLDQHLKLLAEDEPLIRAVWPEPDPAWTEQRMRDLLGSFGLHGDTVDQPVKQLSGGERSRAALAKLTVAGTNVLILDEPTSHLDIWACDALEEALKSYEGTCIVVSHDRYFLNRVVDLLIVFEPSGRTEVVYGNYDLYESLRASRAEAEAAERGGRGAAVHREALPSASSSASAKQKRKRKYPFKKATEVEADIAALETRLADLEAALTTADVYREPAKLKATMAEIDAGKTKLPLLYEHWEEAVELNG